jgi:dTDP-4-amino-4,6-dideoxygalactose transaminase
MKQMPALLGGKPVFNSKIPIAKPLVPDAEELHKELSAIFTRGVLTNGPHLNEFETLVAEHLGVNHAVAVSSATSGLMLAFQALNLVGEVVVPSFTFMATVSALVWAGVTPVFADVDSATTNIAPAQVEALITAKTSAVVAVHNSGNPAEIAELESLAESHNLALVFDAAHALGSLYRGTPVGKQGDVQVFSLSPTKLVIANEGGIVATNDDLIAKHVRLGREYGKTDNYDSAFAGINARMPECNALLAKRSLRDLEAAVEKRNLIAALYHDRLSRLPGISFQSIREGNRSSYKDFSIMIDPTAFGLTRNDLSLALEAENIETRRYYDPPVHRQTAYRSFTSPAATLRNTELLSATILNLPIWSHMDDEVVLGVCLAIERVYKSAEQIRHASLQAASA